MVEKVQYHRRTPNGSRVIDGEHVYPDLLPIVLWYVPSHWNRKVEFCMNEHVRQFAKNRRLEPCLASCLLSSLVFGLPSSHQAGTCRADMLASRDANSVQVLSDQPAACVLNGPDMYLPHGSFCTGLRSVSCYLRIESRPHSQNAHPDNRRPLKYCSRLFVRYDLRVQRVRLVVFQQPPTRLILAPPTTE